MADTHENSSIRLGLRENLGQFSLLVLINAFVGMMVGLERTVVPLIGEKEFGLASKTAIVSFIVSFGVTKAVCNLVAATISERVGRKIAEARGRRVPYLAVVGGREAESGTVQVRNRAGEQSTEPLEDFAQRVTQEIAERRR